MDEQYKVEIESFGFLTSKERKHHNLKGHEIPTKSIWLFILVFYLKFFCYPKHSHVIETSKYPIQKSLDNFKIINFNSWMVWGHHSNYLAFTSGGNNALFCERISKIVLLIHYVYWGICNIFEKLVIGWRKGSKEGSRFSEIQNGFSPRIQSQL